MAEVRIFGFPFAPKGWALCQGQLLPINQNQALFALLGTTYGGNGQTTFALPDFRGRAPVHVGQGAGLPNYTLGQLGGEENHTLLTTEIPSHGHTAAGSTATADTSTPVSSYWAAGNQIYASTSNGAFMRTDALGTTGSNQPHNNMQPYLALNFSIALVGVFPSRN